MAYADYNFYVGEYKGNRIKEEDFPGLEIKAASYLDYLTRERTKRLPNPTHAVKMGVCAVAEAYLANQEGGGIASERLGERSISYVVGVSKSKTEDQRLLAAAYLYLANTNLIGRWL